MINAGFDRGETSEVRDREGSIVAKVRVPIYNTPGKATTIDSEATKGAVVGATLWLQDGTLVTEEMLFATEDGDDGELDFTYWKLVHEIPVNVVALAETASTGLYAITGDGTSATRTIQPAPGETTVADGDGVADNPVVGLANVAPSAGGSLQKTAFDAKGRRSQEEAATTDDLAEGVANLYFTNARADARIDLQKGQPNGLAPLDAGGKLDGAFLPDLAITDTFVVASEAAMLALTAQRGDVAVRTDLNQSFILTAEPASVLANWQDLLTPTSPVTSVFGRVGNVVAQTGDYTFAQIGSKPTTLGGYGITDAVDTANTQSAGGNKTWTGIASFHAAGNVKAVFGDGLGVSQLHLDSAAGTVADFIWRSGGSNRWIWRKGGDAESGSNAGSTMQLLAVEDDGSTSHVVLNVARATQVVNFSQTPTVAGATMWYAGNDGAGSGLDADTLDGFQTSVATVVNTVPVRTAAGDLDSRTVRTNLANQATISGAIAFRVNDGADPFLRYCSNQSAVRSWLETNEGIYTPTLTAVANVASASAVETRWMRSGSIVFVSGRIIVTPTAAATLTGIQISLPIASAMTAGVHLSGVSAGNAGVNFVPGNVIAAFSIDDDALLQFISATNTAHQTFFQFSYRII